MDDDTIAGLAEATAEDLFAPRAATISGFPEDDVELVGIGRRVRVRGLSRLEAIYIQSSKKIQEIERRTLNLGMVSPTMTEDEAGKWQRASLASEIDPVTTRIGQLSGMLEDAGKAAYKSVRDESDAGVRVLPSPTAVDDGGPTPGADE